MKTKRTNALTVRLAGRDVELECAGCAFTLLQELREPIPERCPRCGKLWRR